MLIKILLPARRNYTPILTPFAVGIKALFRGQFPIELTQALFFLAHPWHARGKPQGQKGETKRLPPATIGWTLLAFVLDFVAQEDVVGVVPAAGVEEPKRCGRLAHKNRNAFP